MERYSIGMLINLSQQEKYNQHMRSKVRKVKHNYHYSNPTFIRGAYKKALLVIESCENEYHIKATKKYN